MKQSAIQRRVLCRRWFSLLLAAVFAATAPCSAQRKAQAQNAAAPSLIDVPNAPPHSASDTLRRALAYAEQMRPAGLLPLLGSPTATLARLDHTPELHHAVELAAPDQDGTLPYHLEGTFTLTSDIGSQRSGTLEADRYNDRWSRLTVTLGATHASTALLDGRRSTDDHMLAIPFGLQRLLRALFDPLGTVITNKVPITQDQVSQDGTQLHCTVLARQPPLDPGMQPASRSVCVDPTTGDLRLDVGGYGFRTTYGNIQIFGRRRIATHLQVLQGDTVVADLQLKIRIAGDLVPASFTAPASPIASEPHFCWVALPWQVRNDMETLDAHIVPKDDSVFKLHIPVVVARVLAGTDGRLADVEVLGGADPRLRERALKVLRSSVFRRREWKDQPVSIEGLLVLGTP